MPSVEERLVGHICESSFEDLPQAALEAARREVLWCLGTSFAGAAAPGSQLILEFARDMGAHGRSSVIGHDQRLSFLAAGFANGCFAKALEYEDKWWMDHGCAYAIGTAVVPAAFAIADEVGGIAGRDFLAAVAIATDVEARLIKVVPQAIYSQWNPSYLFAAFGAAIVAARLLKLDKTTTHNALGLAYAQAAGNRQSLLEGVLANRIQMGFGVRNGLSAARLAQRGASGAKEFLTGKFGLYPSFQKDAQIRPHVLTEALGEHFLGSELGFKAYPCCAVTHPALDALASILAQQPVAAESVQGVTIHGSERMRITVEPRALRQVPRTHPDAQFSMAWSAACLIIDGKLRLSHFTDATLNLPRYAELSGKVATEMSLERSEVSVEIRLKDGRTLRSRPVQAPKGHPDNPQSLDEIIDTYRDCMKHGPKRLSLARTERALDDVLRLQDIADVSAVARLLCEDGG